MDHILISSIRLQRRRALHFGRSCLGRLFSNGIRIDAIKRQTVIGGDHPLRVFRTRLAPPSRALVKIFPVNSSGLGQAIKPVRTFLPVKG